MKIPYNKMELCETEFKTTIFLEKNQSEPERRTVRRGPLRPHQ